MLCCGCPPSTPPTTDARQAVTGKYYTKEIMYSQEWISPYMCAAFWSDILVIISLGRYLYMFLFHIEEGPVKGARLRGRCDAYHYQQLHSPLYDTQHI